MTTPEQPAQHHRRRNRSSPNPRYAAIRVDAHFFDDSIDAKERAAADVLISLAEENVLSIAVPYSVRKELDHPNTPLNTRQCASRLPFTYDTGLGRADRLALAKQIMRGNALSGRHDADASHVYDAVVWQAGYFVTCDTRVHKKAAELAAAFEDVWIVSPSRLLEILREWEDSDATHPLWTLADGHPIDGAASGE